MSLLKYILTSPQFKPKFAMSQQLFIDILMSSNVVSAQDRQELGKKHLINSFSSFFRFSALIAPVWIVLSNPVSFNIALGLVYPLVAIPAINRSRLQDIQRVDVILEKYIDDENLKKIRAYANQTRNSEDANQIIDSYIEEKRASH